MNKSVETLYQELLLLDEHPRIEAKRASAIGDSIMQTVCAFANEPGLGGGWLLLGVGESDEEHDSYWLTGIQNSDKLINDLQNNCRNQFDQTIPIQTERATIEGKLVIAVFIPELEAMTKPCRFIGNDKKNKRKTGVWRRGANSDYECTERELEPILLAKSGLSFEQIIFADADWDDLEPSAIALYRQLRGRVRPHAPELQVDDKAMLIALNMIKKQGDHYKPNVAGLLLFGKSLALRRFLPATRVDYVRVAGIEWVGDAEERFVTTLDLREPLLRLIPQLEAAVMDDMPRYFILEEGQTQRSDQPLLPYKVVREAIVNALMHRDYQQNQPTIIVRYSNRIEIRNAGYSLKPEEKLGETGSCLRNPAIANVLYDVDYAETKGTGIGTMRRLLAEAGLTAPMFASHHESNQFTAVYLLHQLLGEEQLRWLQQFQPLHLSNDEAKILILVRELGAVDNAAVRGITGLDTLAASKLLNRLSQKFGLLEKGGRSSATYYKWANDSNFEVKSGDLELKSGDLELKSGDLELKSGDLELKSGDFITKILPEDLQNMLSKLSKKSEPKNIQLLIVKLCAVKPWTTEEIAQHVNRRSLNPLKQRHLTPLRKKGLIDYLYPEVVNHPQQAYQITRKGHEWLLKQET